MKPEEVIKLEWGDYVILNEYASRIKELKRFHNVPMFVTKVKPSMNYNYLVEATWEENGKHNTFKPTEIKKKVTRKDNPEYFL